MRVHRTLRLAVVVSLVMAGGAVHGRQDHVGTILSCAPRALVGETVCVCGKFPDPAPSDGFRIDGRPVRVVSSNPANVKLQLPPDITPGPHAITGAGGITGRAVVEVVAPRVWLEMTQLEFTQQTHVHVAAEGTRAILMVRLTNANPEFVTLGGGDEQRLPTNGATPNEIPRREVKAGSFPGRFVIHAEIDVGPCPCGITPPTGTGSAGGSVGNPPGGQPPGGQPPGGQPPGAGGMPPGGGATGTPPSPPSSTPPSTQLLPLGVLLERDDDDWIPAAAQVEASCPPSGGSPATTLTARLYELTEEGWAPTEQKRPITIAFTRRSNEKGRALNAPVLAGPEDGPDLHFPAARNSSFKCEDDQTGAGLFGRCTTSSPVNTAKIVVQSTDFGGFGVTEGSCPDCVPLVKKTDGAVVPRGSAGTATRLGYEVAVSVPKDINRNGIADAALTWERADPAEDVDDTPQSRRKGDGLTAYEEYRGLYAMACHIRTDPTVKDLFVANSGRFNLDLFRTTSGLMVWEIDLIREWKNRVVNFNRGHASVVNQHGLHLKDVSAGPGAAGLAQTYGPPKNVGYVIVDRFKTRGSDDAIVAHELGHGVGMHHHGDIETDLTSPPPGYVPASPLAVPLAANDLLVLGHVGDQGSGDYSCIMRYIKHGDIVLDASAPGGYCRINEWHDQNPEWRRVGQTGKTIPPPPGLALQTRFCNSPSGTGPNANGRCQGDATAGRGDCKAQLVVSDRW